MPHAAASPASASVVILVADGARPDTLAAALDRGALPALARLRTEGALRTVTSVFPSVTGPAYTPFLMGRYPGPVGLPGLRWYDRAHTATSFPHYTRSYVGSEMRKVDRDLSPDAPTLFELAGPGRSVAALSVIARGLSRRDRLGNSLGFALRAARTHFAGNVRGWLAIDRDIGHLLAARIRERRPRVVFAALIGIDKTSHSQGHDAAVVVDAMRIVDETVAEIRHDAEQDGRWAGMHLWVVSDHGHSPVTRHEDLSGLVDEWGHRAIAHPWVHRPRRVDVAVMVSGNAMAHIYLDLASRTRPWWPELGRRWAHLAQALGERPSVDLLLLPHSPAEVEIRAPGRGMAQLSVSGTGADARYTYRPCSGDPLGVGEPGPLDRDAAHQATLDGDYPDSLVQIAHLAGSPRSGDIILSAARDWDFRAKYEPIPHVSSHGALHREHMLVPLLGNRPIHRPARRTVDIMPSAVQALGLTMPSALDGASFL
jgi:hypothetical protein